MNQNNIFYRQVLAARTAGTNDHNELELLGPEQPECNSKPQKYCSGTPARYHFLIRNVVKGENNGKHQSFTE
ncbi:hypothetical protein A2U01_0034765, partial [Trifolium medium]|nr:hypothetical protein [Trifolium medium]